MSWLAKNKLDRITKVFKRAKERKTPIFNEDIEALKFMYNFINEKSVSGSSVHPLFLKILTVYLFQNSSYYGGINQALKSLNEVLSKPLGFHLQMLTDHLNNIELDNFFKEKGFGDKIYRTKEEEQKHLELIKENEKEIIEKLKNAWTYEQVETSFYRSANGYITNLDYYI